jgi:hypothetical protein
MDRSLGLLVCSPHCYTDMVSVAILCSDGHRHMVMQPLRRRVEHAVPAGSMLWVDKWKPKNSADLVGNISAQNVMRQWLKDWRRVHVLGAAPSQVPGARGAKMDLSKKALLISGSPGTGKTTAAQIIGRCATPLSGPCPFFNICHRHRVQSCLATCHSLGLFD